MLNKEEIETYKKTLLIMSKNANKPFKTAIKAILKYIEDLESAKGIKEALELANMSVKDFVYFKYKVEELETEEQKLIEINDKYLQKLVYALTPTQHALGDNYNNEFKKIIADNIDLETCKIKRLLKECWGTDKY